jgi:hypothetical protein
MPETIDEIRSLADDLEKDAYSARFQEFRTDQAWYDGEVNVAELFPTFEKPEEIEAVILPMAQWYINGFTDHMVNSNRRIVAEINPKQIEDDGEKDAISFAHLRQDFLGFFHRRVNRVTEDIRPDRNVAKYLGLRGMACKELIFNKEQHERTGFGFRIEAHDPWTLLPDPALRDKQYVIRKYQVTLGQARKTWPNFIFPDHESSRDTMHIDVLRYCDKDVWRTIIGNEMDEQANDFGFLPFIFSYNGLGLTTDREKEQVDRFAIQSRSLLYNIRNTLEHRVKLDTSIFEALANGIWSPVKAINITEPDEGELDFRRGRAIPLEQRGDGADEDLQYMVHPPLDPNLWTGVGHQMAALDRAAGASVLQGQSDQTQSSALEFENRLVQARLLFGEAMESYIAGDITIGERVQAYLEKHNLNVTVAFQDPTAVQGGNRTIVGKDLDGFYDHGITMLAPGQEKIDHQQLITRIQVASNPGPGPTMEWALSGQDGIDPVEMVNKKWREQVRFSPDMMAVASAFAANELNIALQTGKQEAEADAVENRLLDAVSSGQQAGEAQAFNETNVNRQNQAVINQGQPGQANESRGLLGANTGANANGN